MVCPGRGENQPPGQLVTVVDQVDQVSGNVLGRAIATAVVKNNLGPVHP